jgi:4'-phosphopantetheinyl transferase
VPEVVISAGRPVAEASVADLLSADDVDRIAALRRPIDRARFATGRALLRLLVAARVGIAAADVQLEVRCPGCGGGHGRPLVLGPPDEAPVHVGVSHAGDWVLVAVAGRAVGVDVESCGQTEFAGFDDLALTAEEQRALAGMPTPDRPVARTTAWVQKEAILKLHGIGLRAEPSSVQVGLSPADRVVPDPLRTDAFVALSAIALDPDHRASLAVAGRLLPRISFVPADSLLASLTSNVDQRRLSARHAT